MMGALLKQMLSAYRKHIPNATFDLLNQQRKKAQNPKLDEVLHLLKLILQGFDKIYICIDAIDECNDSQRKPFVQSLSTPLSHFKSIRVFVTGRLNMMTLVERSFPVLPCAITLEANEEDIRMYIRRQLETDGNYDDMDEAFKKEIMDKIVETADGMFVAGLPRHISENANETLRFLLPALQIQTVLEETSIAKRRASLNTIPKKLDDAYQATIDRIRRQGTAKSNQGMEVLKWTYLTLAPLSIIELRHALGAVNSPNREYLDVDDLPFEKSLLDCCYGLVVIDKKTPSVRLVHKSLQDFLQQKHKDRKLFEMGHCDIARACLTYMAFRDSTLSGDLNNDPNTVAFLLNKNVYVLSVYRLHKLQPSPHIQKFPFLSYAIHYWGEHARKQIDAKTTIRAVDLLLNQDPVRISRNLSLAALAVFRLLRPGDGSESSDKFHWDIPFLTVASSFNQPSALHLAAHFGLDEIATILLGGSHKVNINLKIFSETPLMISSGRGHESFIRLLLEKEGIVSELRDDQGDNALLHAVGGGGGSPKGRLSTN